MGPAGGTGAARVGGSGGVTTVRTTGIYCRSGCSGRPLPGNTGWSESVVAAEVAGYRPCLRCRPDHLPVVAIAEAADPLVVAALELINDGVLDVAPEADLADRLGVSGRHLRRVFRAAVGATPTQVAISRRAHFARFLLDDTDLSVTEIAFASRFGSVRRMNEVMRATFGFSPSELRAKRRGGERCSVDGGIRLRLRVDRHHRFGDHLRKLADRAVTGVESVADGSYRRATNVCGLPAAVEVRSPGDGVIEVEAHVPALGGLIDVVARCRRVFRLDHEGDGPPGHWSSFEGALRATVEQRCRDPRDVLHRLAITFGAPVPGAGRLGVTHQFPDPTSLLGLAAGRIDGLDAGAAMAVTELARQAVGDGTGR